MPRPPKNYAAAMRWYVSPFPHTAELAERFGFSVAFPLRERLDAAGMHYRCVVRNGEPTLPERRKRLELIEREARSIRAGRIDRAEALALLLYRSAGGLAGLVAHVEHCFDRPPHQDGARAVFPDVVQAAFSPQLVKRILDEVARARRHLPRGAPGARLRPEARILVREIAAIWRDGTGRPPTVTTRPADGKRGGRFLEFALEVARCLGVETSTDALWSMHSRWKE